MYIVKLKTFLNCIAKFITKIKQPVLFNLKKKFTKCVKNDYFSLIFSSVITNFVRSLSTMHLKQLKHHRHTPFPDPLVLR
jgi:hypothetical protein